MKRLVGILIPMVILGALISWRLLEKRAERADLEQQRGARSGSAPRVAVTPAELRDIRATFKATGTLEAPSKVKLSPRVSGRITFLQAREGDRVGRDEVLVRIDSSEVEAQVRQQQAGLAEAQSRLAQALISRGPTEAGISTQIRQQQAAVESARADLAEASANLEHEVAAAQASVVEMQGRVDSAHASIDNAHAAIASAGADLANASIKRDRILELYEQGFIAAQDVDDAKATVAVAQARVDAAQGQLRSAEASRDSARAQQQAAQEQVEITRTRGDADVEAARQRLVQANAALDFARANTASSPAYEQGIGALKASVAAARAAVAAAEARRADTVLTSPLDGQVTGRYADPGDVAGTGQPILDIEFFRQIWVSFAVPDDVCSCLHIGHEAEVRFDALPEREFTASIVQINPAADPQTRQFTVRAVLSNDEDLFRPGMFAHVTLVTEQLTQVVAVPREAVQQDEAGDYVTIVDDQDQAQRRAVVLGLSDAQYMSVLEGLEAGEAVVTVAATPVEPGQTVRTGDDEGGGGDGRGNDGPGGGRRGAPGDGPDAASPAEGARAEGGPAAGAQAR
jgi:HlyD family secretion protein